MKKITIALPEEMITEVHKLANKMGKQDFWTLAITWRQLIKKGLAYYEKDTGKKKKGSSKTKASEEPKDQENNSTMPEGEEAFDKVVEMLKAEKEGKDIQEMLKKLYPEDKK